MKKRSFVALIFSLFLFSNAGLYALWLPAYPFEVSYSLYSGDKKGDVSNFLHINAGLRFEALKQVYFDLSFLGDIFLHVNKKNGLYGEMLQKDAREFLNASINFPSITGLPLSLSFFFGKYDELGSFSILREHVKSLASSSPSMKSYPANIFRPNLDVKGLGLALYGAASNGFYTGFYTYWNAKNQDAFVYTNDFRFGFSYSTFSFESFLGFVAKKNAGDFRLKAGLVGNIDIDEYELFFEMGFAELAFQKMSFAHLASQFYVLFEPRVQREFFNASVSFFMSSPFQLPKDLESKKLRNTNFLGFNLLFGFGNLEMHKMNGGFSLLTAVNLFNITEVTPFTFSIAPFFTFSLHELEFNMRMPINPLLYKDLKRAVTFEFSIKAVY